MHEIEMATKVLREAKNAGAKSFVRVEVGELCEITSEEMEEGLKKISTGSLDLEAEHKHAHDSHANHTHDISQKDVDDLKSTIEGWKFEVTEVKSKIKCDCGFQGVAKIVDRGHGYCVFSCPFCNSKPDVLEGGEIKIVAVE